MRLHARDVIYYPDRLSENSNTANQEGGHFFLQDVCSHIVIPKKQVDTKTGKEWITLNVVSMSICNLNASDLARPEEGDLNLDYVGQIDLEARKVGELHRRYRCMFDKFDVSTKHHKDPLPFDFANLNVLDVIGEWYEGPDIVTGETIGKMRMWAVASLKHKACVSNDMFDIIAGSSTAYNLDHVHVDENNASYFTYLESKGWLKYFKDFNVSACRLEGKFKPVWRVKLTL